MTDDCLQYCDQDLFLILFDAIEHNEYSSLTLLDLSRNIHTFDISEAVHLDLLDALSRQKRKAIPDERPRRSEAEGGEPEDPDSKGDGRAAKRTRANERTQPSQTGIEVTQAQDRQQSRASSGHAGGRKSIEFSYLETLIFTTPLEDIRILYMDLVENEEDDYATSLQVIINERDFREQLRPR